MMTEAIRKQERVFKRLFIFLSAILGLVILTAVLPPCEAEDAGRNDLTRINAISASDQEAGFTGCIFTDYLLTDHLFG
jgi:hypothetical protein